MPLLYLEGLVKEIRSGVLSKMPENGIIFSDGMEEDAIEFNSGVEVNIGMSEWKGCLVR